MSLANRRLCCALTSALFAVGCGAAEDESEPPATTAGCAVGEYGSAQGTCCPMGTEALEDGTCAAAGIAADGCGAGFMSDGQQGCEAVLPTQDCPFGELAVPGDATCREVAPCGDGKWGDIPVDGQTQYVDGSYVGGDGNGSELRPWPTIQAGVDAAEAGAVVAIAAGSYAEDVLIRGKAVQLWGRCPAMVEVTGAEAAFAAIMIENGAPQTEIRQLAVTGSQAGLAVTGSTDVLLDRLWIHDTGHLAIDIEALDGETSVTLQHSLLEECLEDGVLLGGAELTIDASAIRDIRQASTGPWAGEFGFGVALWSDYGHDGVLTMTGSLIDRATLVGVRVSGALVHLERTVVRSTQAGAQGIGWGLVIEADSLSGRVGHGVVDRSVFVGNRDVGVNLSGGSVVIDGTTIRGTLPDDFGYFGRGLNVQSEPTESEPTRATIRHSLIADNRDVGMFVSGAEVEAVATLIRDTGPDVAGRYGRGLNIRSHPGTNLPARVQLRSSLVTDNQDVGVFVGGSELLVEHSAVRRSSPLDNGAFGDGLAAVSDSDALATVELRDSSVDAAARAGVSNFGSTVRLERTHLLCCPISLNGELASSFQAGGDPLPFVFEDRGENRCVCDGTEDSCAVLSTGLAPPDPL